MNVKKYLGWFSILFIILSFLIAANGRNAQAQQGGREVTHSAGNPDTAIITGVSPAELAGAMGIPLSSIVSASFNGSDPDGFGIGDAPLGNYFPTVGSTFAILSTGLATDADTPNDTGNLSTTLDGLNNSQEEDITQFQIELQVPQQATCAGFDFAFYSEEFPEFVGSSFNDTFTAELGGTDLTIDPGTSEVIAPLNFAFGAIGEIISVNTAYGVGSPTASTYDGYTSLLRATTPVDGGSVALFVFSIQDLGDSSWDSAVFIDNFFWGNEFCQSGTIFPPNNFSVDPEMGGSFTYTAINGSTTTIDVMPDSVTLPTAVTFTPLFSPTQPLPSSPTPALMDLEAGGGQAVFANHAFELTASVLDKQAYLPFVPNGVSAAAVAVNPPSLMASPAVAASPQGPTGTFPFSQPVRITIQYTDEEMAEVGIDEATLRLLFFDERYQEWHDVREECDPFYFNLDVDNNLLEVDVCHFTEFGMVGN